MVRKMVIEVDIVVGSMDTGVDIVDDGDDNVYKPTENVMDG